MSATHKTIMFYMSKSKVIESMGIQISLTDLQYIADGRVDFIDWESYARTMYFTTREQAFEVVCSYADFNSVMSFYNSCVLSDYAEKFPLSSHLKPGYWMRLHEAETRDILKKTVLDGRQLIKEFDEVLAAADIFGEQVYDDKVWKGGLDNLDIRGIDYFRMFELPLFGVDFYEVKAEALYDF
jgi:hypothetical protein